MILLCSRATQKSKEVGLYSFNYYYYFFYSTWNKSRILMKLDLRDCAAHTHQSSLTPNLFHIVPDLTLNEVMAALHPLKSSQHFL